MRWLDFTGKTFMVKNITYAFRISCGISYHKLQFGGFIPKFFRDAFKVLRTGGLVVLRLGHSSNFWCLWGQFKTARIFVFFVDFLLLVIFRIRYRSWEELHRECRRVPKSGFFTVFFFSGLTNSDWKPFLPLQPVVTRGFVPVPFFDSFPPSRRLLVSPLCPRWAIIKTLDLKPQVSGWTLLRRFAIFVCIHSTPNTLISREHLAALGPHALARFWCG